MRTQNSGMVIGVLVKRARLFVAASLPVVLVGAGWELLAGMQATAQTASRVSSATGSRQESIEIPVGTILPVKINHGFSSKNAKSGQVITARVMQNVRLSDGEKIPGGAQVIGKVLSATPAGKGGGRITLRFDQLQVHHRNIPIVSALRALASLTAVDEAAIPDPPAGVRLVLQRGHNAAHWWRHEVRI
jgi:hypothetical protein